MSPREKERETHIIEESFFGVFPELFVESLLENAHPRRHQQGKSQHGNTWTHRNKLNMLLIVSVKSKHN